MIKFLRRLIPIFGPPPPVTPLVRLEGEIGSGGRFARGLNLAGLELVLTRAFNTPDAVAVAFSINSPGGSPVQARLIHDRIRALAAEKKLPVLMFCEDLAASGGYMIACAGDEIFADESSLVGSIGVVGAGFGAADALKKLGVERRIYTAGKHKVRLDPFQPETKDDVAFVARIQSAIHESFIALVQTRRGMKLDETTELFEGDIWTGLDAVRLGLIDGIGHAGDILREKFGERVDIRPIPAARRGLLRRLGMSAQGPAEIGGLSGHLAGDVADAVLDRLEARALWARFGL